MVHPRKTQSRGVNATSSDISRSLEVNVPNESLSNTRNQIQSAIETLGSATPLVHNSGLDVDNDDSIYSTSISSVVQVHIHERLQTPTSYSLDDTQTISELPPDSDCCINEEQSQMPCRYPILQPVVPRKQRCKNTKCSCVYTRGRLENRAVQTNNRNINGRQNALNVEKTSAFSKFLDKLRGPSKDTMKEPFELYRVNIKPSADDESPPRRFVFDLINGVPKPCTNDAATNTKCAKACPTNIYKDTNTRRDGIYYHHGQTIVNENLNRKAILSQIAEDSTKVDVYFFDHGNAAYYRTTDLSPVIGTEILAEKIERNANRFWANIFGALYIAFAQVTTFILQFIRFVLHAIVRPLTVGLLQLTSDYFFKPLLAVLFNGVIQPPLIFLYNIAISLRDLCDPIAEGLGYFFREIAVLCRSIRLFEIKHEREIVVCHKNDTANCAREKDRDGRKNKATQCSDSGSYEI